MSDVYELLFLAPECCGLCTVLADIVINPPVFEDILSRYYVRQQLGSESRGKSATPPEMYGQATGFDGMSF